MNIFYLNSNKMFFLFILINSTLITISSNSWISCWIGLEINLLSFIPLISNMNNLLSSETSLKYFLTQSIASINLLFLIIMINLIKSLENFYFINLMMNLPLLMKMGSAPFHFWFISLMEGMSWFNCFLIMTWQKIAPMIMISYNYNFNFLFIIILINAVIGSIGGLNSLSLRKILAFSSINNMGWMLGSMMISENLWMLYFLIYSIMNFTICYMMNFMNIFYLNQIFFINLKSQSKIMFLFNFFSLSGLPPFLGFFSKWLTINFLINYNMYMLNFILIMTSLIMIYFYMRISYSAFIINYLKLKWFKMKNNYINKMMTFYCFFSLLGLPISTFIFF